MQDALPFTQNLLRYWRQAEELLQLIGSPLDRNPLIKGKWIDSEHLEKGQLSEEILQVLFPNAAGITQSVEIWVAPFVGLSAGRQSKQDSPPPLVPLWIPAYGFSDGIIDLDHQRPFGFISPKFLDALSGKLPQLGKVTVYDTLLRQLYFDEQNALLRLNWPSGYHLAQDLLAALSGSDWQSLLQEAGYDVCDKGLVCLRGQSRTELQYSEWIGQRQRGEEIPPLVYKYVNAFLTPKAPINLEDCLQEATEYCGHFPGARSLTEEQYVALIHALKLPEQEILAIQTPLGVDEAFCQALVATLWVKSALAQKPCPIIQYSEKQLPTHWPALFEKLNGGQNILLHLKDTKNVYEKVVNHLFTLVQEKWVLENVWPNLDEVKGCLHNILSENVTALKEALDLLKEYYDKTEQDAELYGQRGGAGEILKSMRAQDNALERQQSTLFKLTKRWQAHQARHTFLNKYFKWIPGRKKKQVAFSKKIIEACEANHLLDDLKETLPLSEKLTTKIRQLKVQRAKIHRDIVTISDVLTAREGAKHRFLCHLQKYLPDSVSFHQNWIKLSFFETFSVLQSLMGQRLLALAYYYYLTSFLIDWKKAGTLDLDSILVQTLSQGMLTSLSNAASQKEVMFDLALIDEAQNKLPMRPTGWLAKSRLAIFLGDDTRPILVPPTTPFLDDFDAKFFALADTEEELEDLQLQGMLATTGCAFEVAKKRSYFQELDPLGEGVGPALTLRPASRVHPFLVSVVNDDILSTTESSHKENQPSTGIPIMGYCHVRGQIQKKAGTFLNPVEAFCVASWLFENKDSLRDKTVCVVTPFVQQKDLIEIYCKNNDVRCVVKLCTQLTDQKFDLVIFSAVYTLVCPKPYLFDEVPGLLKTLILSAKNHFLVFGQMDIFDPFTHTASGHFAKKLYQYGTPILPPQRLVPEEYFSRARNGLQRLQNIAQHQAHLTEILRSGKDIHIASFKVSEKDLVTLLEKVSLEEAPKISIYLGMNWPNASTKNYSASIEDLLKRLVAHGVRIHLVRGLHSNALWGDEKTFTEGYGPWLALGADPKEGAPMISLSYPEPLALQRIKDFKDYLTAHTIRAYM